MEVSIELPNEHEYHIFLIKCCLIKGQICPFPHDLIIVGGVKGLTFLRAVFLSAALPSAKPGGETGVGLKMISESKHWAVRAILVILQMMHRPQFQRCKNNANN